MGAWIEIGDDGAWYDEATPSHPTWVRGLKLFIRFIFGKNL